MIHSTYFIVLYSFQQERDKIALKIFTQKESLLQFIKNEVIFFYYVLESFYPNRANSDVSTLIEIDNFNEEIKELFLFKDKQKPFEKISYVSKVTTFQNEIDRIENIQLKNKIETLLNEIGEKNEQNTF